MKNRREKGVKEEYQQVEKRVGQKEGRERNAQEQ